MTHLLSPSMQAELSKARTRGAAAQRATAYAIEGEYMTRKQIGDRLGITEEAVRSRMNRLKKLPGAITWEKLK